MIKRIKNSGANQKTKGDRAQHHRVLSQRRHSKILLLLLAKKLNKGPGESFISYGEKEMKKKMKKKLQDIL